MTAEEGVTRRGLLPIAPRLLRTEDVMAFTSALAVRHPELLGVIGWPQFAAIAAREGVPVRVGRLSRPARLLRLGRHVQIQLSAAIDRRDRAYYGMHELSHYWRDDPGERCYHAAEEWECDPAEDFANMFAWYVTSAARPFVDSSRTLRTAAARILEAE